MTTRGRPITVTDEDLLDAARDVFLAHGLDATTTEIAQRAHISESVIFYRYKAKEALFAAVFKRQLVMPPEFARLGSLVGHGEIADNLFDAGMGLVALMQTLLPLLMMSLSSTKMNLFRQHARHPHPIKKQMIGALSGYFEGESRSGRLRAVEGEILARTFLGGIMQYVMSKHFEGAPDPMGAPTFLRGMISVFLHGTLLQNTLARPPRRASRSPIRRRKGR